MDGCFFTFASGHCRECSSSIVRKRRSYVMRERALKSSAPSFHLDPKSTNPGSRSVIKGCARSSRPPVSGDSLSHALFFPPSLVNECRYGIIQPREATSWTWGVRIRKVRVSGAAASPLSLLFLHISNDAEIPTWLYGGTGV